MRWMSEGTRRDDSSISYVPARDDGVMGREGVVRLRKEADGEDSREADVRLALMVLWQCGARKLERSRACDGRVAMACFV
jgi:hypothetical protein